MSISRRNLGRLLLATALPLCAASPLFPLRSLAQSWAPYLELLKKDKSQGVKSAAIYGLDGAKWAATVEAKAGEIPVLVAGMKDSTKFQANGIVFGGVKYMYLTNRSPQGIVGRKGPNSILMRTTAKAIIIVITNDGANPANITSIDFVADDLSRKKF